MTTKAEYQKRTARKRREGKKRAARKRMMMEISENGIGIRTVSKKCDADGILRRRSRSSGEMQEFCMTPEAKAKRREEIYLAFKQRCGLCAKDLHPDRWEWHHVQQKSLGGDDSLANGMPLCKYPANPHIGLISCHDLVHRPDLIAKKFRNDEATRERYMKTAHGTNLAPPEAQ